MKKYCAVLALLFLVGCVPTDEDMLRLSDDVDALMVSIDSQQSKIVGEIDKVQDHVKLVNDAMRAAETVEGKAAAGIEASRPFNPYADQMSAILAATTALGGLFWRKKSKEADAAKAKYMAHKQGVERAMMEAEPTTAAAVYDAIGKARASNGL